MTAAIVIPGGTRRMPCNAVFRIRDRHPAHHHPGRRTPLLMSSRTARSAEPGSRRALAAPLDPRFALRAPGDDSEKQNALPLPCSFFDVIPADPLLFLMSSRTVHRAGPASHPGRRHPLIDDIPDAIPLLDVIPGPPQAEPGIQRRCGRSRGLPAPDWSPATARSHGNDGTADTARKLHSGRTPRRTEAPRLRTETATAGSSVRLAPVGAVAGLDLQRHVQCGGALHALDEAGAHRLQRVQAHLQH